jgi:4-hydroxythreonine-4-phosphate dehydrogenase
MSQPPVLALTAGEPAGIGPDLVASIAARDREERIVVVADTQCLRQRARRLGYEVRWLDFDPDAAGVFEAGAMEVVDVQTEAPVEPGRLDSTNARYVLETLRLAASGCEAGRFDAMVTAPVHKGVINDSGVHFTGHTEYLASLTGATLPVMMLAAGELRRPGDHAPAPARGCGCAHQ